MQEQKVMMNSTGSQVGNNIGKQTKIINETNFECHE